MFDDPAVLHDVDVVGDPADHRQIVGDEQQGHAEFLLEVLDQLEDLGLDGDIEGGGRFVGDEQGRPAGQGHGDHHPLPLAAGELVRIDLHAGLGIVDAGTLEQPDGLPFRLLFGHLLVQQQRFEHLVADGVDRVERGHRLLKDHGDAVAADGPDLVAVEGEQIPALEEDRTAVRDLAALFEEAQNREGGDRFAGTRFADQGGRHPPLEGERDLVEDRGGVQVLLPFRR